MPDYSENPVGRVDNLHHVEGLLSVNDRAAKKKEQQKQNQQDRQDKEGEEEVLDESQQPQRTAVIKSEDGHIDFCA